MTLPFAILSIIFLMTASWLSYRGIDRSYHDCPDPFAERVAMFSCALVGLGFAILFFATLER